MEFNSAIRGHHIYKEIWSPDVGEELQCKMEHGNIHDMYAVAVTRENIVVGHLPRNISTPCHSLFLSRKGGTNISCVVNGARRFSADLVQGGLSLSPLFLYLVFTTWLISFWRLLKHSSLFTLELAAELAAEPLGIAIC